MDGIRAVAILIELIRMESNNNHHHIGIVRLILSLVANQTTNETEVIRCCLCSSIGSSVTCGHLAVCDSVPDLSIMVYNMLSKNNHLQMAVQTDHPWASVAFGYRDLGRNSTWMSNRTGYWTAAMSNFISVIERRN